MKPQRYDTTINTILKTRISRGWDKIKPMALSFIENSATALFDKAFYIRYSCIRWTKICSAIT